MKDLPALIQNLGTTGDILTQFIAAIPADRLLVQRRAEFWTIAEHVAHLADVQEMLLERIRKFETDPAPNFIPFFPDEDETQPETTTIDIKDALKRFSSLRKEQIDLLNRIDETAWDKTATHPEYEHYSLYILVRHILMHDHWHMYRIEELWLTRDEYLTNVE